MKLREDVGGLLMCAACLHAVHMTYHMCAKRQGFTGCGCFGAQARMRGAQPSTSRPAAAVAHATAEPQLPSDEMVELAVGDLDVHRRPPAAQRLRASTAVAVGEDGGHGASGARRAWPSSTAVIAYASPTYCRLNAWTGSRSLKSWLVSARVRGPRRVRCNVRSENPGLPG